MKFKRVGTGTTSPRTEENEMTVSEPAGNYSVARAWTTVVMLFFVQTINRADKAVLGLAATAIMADLAMSPVRFGLVASSWTPAITVTLTAR